MVKAVLAVFLSFFFFFPKLIYTKNEQYKCVFGSIAHLERNN